MSETNPIPAPDILSDAEKVVYRLVVQGRTSQEIAWELHRSLKTIESHRYSMNRKLGLNNPAALVAWHYETLVLPAIAKRTREIETALKGFIDGECRCADSNRPCVQCVASKALGSA